MMKSSSVLSIRLTVNQITIKIRGRIYMTFFINKQTTKKLKMKDSFQIKKLSVAPVLRFKNKELFDYFVKAISKVGEYEIDDQQTFMLLNNAKRHIIVHNELIKTPLAHELTPEIREKCELCRGYLMRVRDTVKSLSRITDTKDKSLYWVLNNWIRIARSPLGTTVRIDQAEVVRTLSAAMTPEILASLEELGIDEAFTNAVQLNRELIVQSNKRAQDRGNIKNIRLRSREEALFDLQLLFNSFIALANVDNEKQSMYREICIVLDKMLIDAHAVLKGRITRIANCDKNPDNLDSYTE